MNKELKNKDATIKKQIIAKWQEIAKDCDIKFAENWREYNNYINKNEVSVVKLSDKGSDYKKYFTIIYENMKNPQIISSGMNSCRC
jgi:hypothetical protein